MRRNLFKNWKFDKFQSFSHQQFLIGSTKLHPRWGLKTLISPKIGILFKLAFYAWFSFELRNFPTCTNTNKAIRYMYRYRSVVNQGKINAWLLNANLMFTFLFSHPSFDKRAFEKAHIHWCYKQPQSVLSAYLCGSGECIIKWTGLSSQLWNVSLSCDPSVVCVCLEHSIHPKNSGSKHLKMCK